MATRHPYGLHRRGSYWWTNFMVRGKRVHRSTKATSLTVAKDVAEHWHQEAAREGAGLDVRLEAPTLGEAWKAWRRVKEGQFSPRHILNMRAAVEVHALAYLDTPLDQLDNAAVDTIRGEYLRTTGRAHRAGQQWEGVKAHTTGGANTVVKMLSSLCGWAKESGLIQELPFRLKPLKAQERIKAVLWPEQVREFLQVLDSGGQDWARIERHQVPQSATAARLMIGLGLREDEAISAEWPWVDWRRSTFVVGAAKDRALREIPIPRWLLAHLQDLWEGARRPTAGLLLATKEGEPHAPGFTRKAVIRGAQELGIEGLTPHRLRASFATGLFEVGTPLSQIQQMMGHEDPQTTMGYIIQRQKDQAEALDLMSTAMGFSE